MTGHETAPLHRLPPGPVDLTRDPHGVRVSSFQAPTEERGHHFLWPVKSALPQRARLVEEQPIP